MNGIYGTTKPANIDPSKDADIYYIYRPTRSTEDSSYNGFRKVEDTSAWLVPAEMETGTDSTERLVGAYNLNLPLDVFNAKGFYTVYIKPKEIDVKIEDVSVLVGYPDVRGIVFSLATLSGQTDLTGYRVEYYDDYENRILGNNTRLITSSNKCTPVLVTVTDNYPKTTRYQLTEAAPENGLVFCTVTPSTYGTFKPNYSPYIGQSQEIVKLVNTKFNPVMLEIEMTNHDADTLSYMLENDQIRDRDNAIITHYNDDKEIYQQFNYYTIKSTLGVPLYDVKEKRTAIDGTQDFDNIVNGQ